MAGLSRGFRSRRASPLAAGLLLAVTFALTAAAARWDRFAGELRLAREIQRLPAFGPLAEAVRALTTTELVVPIGLVLAAATLIARRGLDGIALAALFLALPAVQSAVKDIVDRPRPGDLLDVRGSATSPSFPSGHVMSGTVLFVALAAVLVTSPIRPAFRRAGVTLLLALAAMNGLANVYEGVHWPSDVLGGYLWAATLLCAAGLLWTWLHARFARCRSIMERR